MPGKPWTAAVAVAAVLVLAGCTPEPAPTPSPTGFTSEEEAFAAAEATYRAYFDAGNQLDLADPATFEPLFKWTTGDQNDRERESLSSLHADGVTVTGESRLVGIKLGDWHEEDMSLVLITCQDVSGVDFVDAVGKSLVSPDRTALQAEQVYLSPSPTSPTGMLIDQIVGAEDDSACAD